MGENQIYEYKCVAGPMVIEVKKSKDRAEAVRAFECIINEQASDGWEYVGIDEFETSEPTGCLGLGGQKATKFKMLAFRRKLQSR